MKYVAKYIEDDESVSEKSEFSYGVRVIFRVALVGVFIYLLLGLMVDYAVPYIPASWEDSLAETVMSEIRTQGGGSATKYDVAAMQSLLDSLAEHMEGPRRKFHINVIEKKETNALALPGGHIVMYSELLEKIKSENELAMILAHELGHFAARDHLRGLGRSFLFFIVTTVIAGSSGESAKALMNSSGILQNNYSRSQEYAADRYALNMLVKKYGHAGGATDFFVRLADKESLPQLTQYLSTHPASKYRIEALNKIIRENNLEIKEVAPQFWFKSVKAEESEP